MRRIATRRFFRRALCGGPIFTPGQCARFDRDHKLSDKSEV